MVTVFLRLSSLFTSCCLRVETTCLVATAPVWAEGVWTGAVGEQLPWSLGALPQLWATPFLYGLCDPSSEITRLLLRGGTTSVIEVHTQARSPGLCTPAKCVEEVTGAGEGGAVPVGAFGGVGRAQTQPHR